MKISNFYSPNFNRRKRPNNSIKIIIIHYTGMQSERESMVKLRNPKSKVSSHFVINQNGKIYRLVQDNQIAWHAGKSCWRKYKNLNKIGYCFSNKKKPFSTKILKAFQRHYRQELINGHVDKECLIIAQNLLKKL